MLCAFADSPDANQDDDYDYFQYLEQQRREKERKTRD